jgi:hypothetical protein
MIDRIFFRPGSSAGAGFSDVSSASKIKVNCALKENSSGYDVLKPDRCIKARGCFELRV